MLCLLVFGGFSNIIFGQEVAKGWEGVPEKYEVAIGIDGKKIRSIVVMQYYLLHEGKKYYRQSNRPNRKFGRDIPITETDKFVVTIGFRPEKRKYRSKKINLRIASLSWISTNGCLIKPTVLPSIIRHSGSKSIIFNLKPNCDDLSNIIIDMDFVTKIKDKKRSTFKKLTFSKEDIFKNLHTDVSIPIKVGISESLNDKKEKNIRLAEQEALLRLSTREKDLNWFKEQLSKIKKEDFPAQIKFLEKLRDEAKNKGRKKLTTDEIKNKAKEMLENHILKKSACSETVKKFKLTSAYNYLDAKDKKRYLDYKNSCIKIEDSITSKKDIEWAKAKSENTIIAYEEYINTGKSENNKTLAKIRIKKIKTADQQAWTKLLETLFVTGNSCEHIRLYDEYLNNNNYTLHIGDAQEKKQEASENCGEFRIESSSKNVTDGIYTFSLKNGTPPFTTTFQVESANININGEEVELRILEGKEYTIKIMDEAKETCELTFTASNPDFTVYKEDNLIVVKGGNPPFDFVSANNKQTSFQERRIKENHLIQELGLKETSSITVYDKNGLMVQNIESSPLGEESRLPKIFFIIPAVLLAGVYLLRKKLPNLTKLFNRTPQSKRPWEEAETLTELWEEPETTIKPPPLPPKKKYPPPTNESGIEFYD